MCKKKNKVHFADIKQNENGNTNYGKKGCKNYNSLCSSATFWITSLKPRILPHSFLRLTDLVVSHSSAAIMIRA